MLPDAAALTALAEDLADAARAETLARFRARELVVDNKAGTGFDPVTEADIAAERAMRAILAERRPGDGIAGEEMDEATGTSGRRWILDPIDGTRAYLAGTPCWGTLIALEEHGAPVLGLIDQPFIGERFLGGFGQARYAGPHGSGPLGTRPPRPLSEAVLFTTHPEIGSDGERAAFEALARAVRLTRYGLDCYAYALLAMGQIDLVVEADLKPCDIAAPIAVIEAAGGRVTNWQGGPATAGGRVIAAANDRAHAAALEFLSGTQSR